MKEQLLKQIENELLGEITAILKNQNQGSTMVTDLYAMDLVADSIVNYKDKLIDKKEELGMSEEEIDDILDEASMNILPKILGE